MKIWYKIKSKIIIIKTLKRAKAGIEVGKSFSGQK